MKDMYYFVIKLRQKLIKHIVGNQEMFNDNERNIGALPMIEVINGLDEMELLEFYLAITEVDEREIFIIIDRIKAQKGVDLPY